MQEMDVVTVGLDLSSMQPLLVLREISGPRRWLPMWIGTPESEAIHSHQQRRRSRRPTTHQLIGSVVHAFGQRLDRVCITALQAGQFHAALVFDAQLVVSCRASDAVALALSEQVSIYAEDAVLDEAGLSSAQVETREIGRLDVLDAHSDAHEIDRFRRLLDTASPEDFND